MQLEASRADAHGGGTSLESEIMISHGKLILGITWHLYMLASLVCHWFSNSSWSISQNNLSPLDLTSIDFSSEFGLYKKYERQQTVNYFQQSPVDVCQFEKKLKLEKCFLKLKNKNYISKLKNFFFVKPENIFCFTIIFGHTKSKKLS